MFGLAGQVVRLHEVATETAWDAIHWRSNWPMLIDLAFLNNTIVIVIIAVVANNPSRPMCTECTVALLFSSLNSCPEASGDTAHWKNTLRRSAVRVSRCCRRGTAAAKIPGVRGAVEYQGL